MECGWMVTELGRQPWIIYPVMLVKDGVTTVAGLGITFFLFTAIYVILAVTLIGLLLRLANDGHPFSRDKVPDGSGAPESPGGGF
jgi:cytochrome bd-type quinol oxidase subunit 1